MEKLLATTIDQGLESTDANTQPPDYSEAELQYRSMLIRRLNQAVDQRNQPWSEFNDQTYDEWYISNQKAANAYVPPKKNRQDVRTVTGTTREKKNTLIAAILNYSLEPEVMAYDDADLPMVELGQDMGDMIKRSRQIESPDHNLKRQQYYNELLDQGTVFVYEQRKDYRRMAKTLKGPLNMRRIGSIDWTERVEKVEKVLESELIAGPMVYLGNMKEFFLELQPYIAIRRVRTRQEAEALYGDWERWKHVPFKINRLVPNADSVSFVGNGANTFSNWRMVEVEQDLVEDIDYFDAYNNEWMKVLNGVMMLPIRFPLSELVGESAYPIAKGDLEPINRFFAYSRSVPAKNKVNQGLIDEMFKAIILKTRKSYEPPIANMTGQTLSPKIWYPGNIVDNVDPDKIREIGQNNGVSGNELQAFQLVKQIIDEGSVSATFEGNTSGRGTAREVQQNQQQALMRLGLTLYGIVQFEKKLAWLRIKNILKNWAEPVDETFEVSKGKIKQAVKKYRKESIETTTTDGRKAIKILEFTDQQLPESEQLMAEEDILSERRGIQVRKVVFNAEDFKNLKYKWHVEVTPQPKDTSELKAAMFIDQVSQGMQLFGPQAFNMDYLKEQWAVINKLNPDKVFIKQQEAPQQPIPIEGPTETASQLMPQPMPRPSVNTMAAPTSF